MRIMLLMLFVAMCYSKNLGYDDEAVYNCNLKYTASEERVILNLFPIDKWMFVIVSPITIMLSIIFIYFFLSDPKLFGLPGDILFVIALTELFKTIHQFISGIYAIIYNLAPISNGTFCQVNGAFATITFILNMIYTLAFAAYPLVLFYNSLESTAKVLRIVNIVISLIVTVPILVIGFTTQSYAVNLNGLCSLAPTSYESIVVLFIGFSLTLVTFIVVSCGIILLFKRLIPKLSPMRSLRGRYLRYYQRFMIYTISMRLVETLCSAISDLNCFYFLQAWLLPVVTIDNIVIAVLPIGQILILSQDPILKTRFDSFFAKFQSKKKSRTDVFVLDTSEMSTNGINLPDMNILQELHSQMKQSQVYSMLAGIQMIHLMRPEQAIAYDKKYNESEEDNSDRSASFNESDVQRLSWCKQMQFTKEDTEEVYQTEINNTVVNQILKPKTEQHALPMKCTLYAPKVFAYFNNLSNIDLESSFDLEANINQIKAFEGPDGGKSGEFFFFSHDRQLIIKTMRWAEIASLRKRMLLYANYLANNPNSLISKIFGIYTFERLELNNAKTHFLIMKNIGCGVKKQFILRTFDMKGSEYDREVLKDGTEDLQNQTLKDTDFFKTENIIYIDPEMSKLINYQLQYDAYLFKSVRLIDYSLLVMKIDWQASGMDVNQHTSNNYAVIPSIKEPGVYYHIAIIDYLQEWNINKEMERNAKKIIKLNAQLDTSAQDPDVYATRFYEKLVNRILPIPQS